jgi:hypothetical protein
MATNLPCGQRWALPGPPPPPWPNLQEILDPTTNPVVSPETPVIDPCDPIGGLKTDRPPSEVPSRRLPAAAAATKAAMPVEPIVLAEVAVTGKSVAPAAMPTVVSGKTGRPHKTVVPAVMVEALTVEGGDPVMVEAATPVPKAQLS